MLSERHTLAEKREEAAKVLREILEKMGVDAEVSAFDDGERIILDAHGSESGLVIGKKGATLDSLQYLVSRIVFKKPGDAALIVVDAEGYRGRREDSLADLAKRLAEKAVRSGRPVPVEPMSPQDRKVSHTFGKKFAGRTESAGEAMVGRVRRESHKLALAELRRIESLAPDIGDLRYEWQRLAASLVRQRSAGVYSLHAD
jgi:spoIIIJ-associated protein